MQAAFFALFVAVFLGMAYPAGSLSNLWLASDPLIMASTVLFFRDVRLPLSITMAALALSAVLLGRAFCGWACPMGFLQDLAGRIPLAGKRPAAGNLKYLRIGLTAAVLAAAFFTMDALSLLDPLAILQRSAYLLVSFSGIPLVLILILSGALIVPRLWCRACPLGGALGILGSASPFGRRVSERCTQCGTCAGACPTAAIEKDGRWHASSCIKCLECERACPKNAVGFSRAMLSRGVSAPRRSVLAAGGVLGLIAVSRAAVSALPGDAGLIRPPGSLSEKKFNAACVRCESCAKACTGRVIRPAGLEAGLERFGTPALDFRAGKCERCGTCGAVCPAGAILSPPEDNIKMGTATIDRERCLAWAQGKKCLVCAEVCPAGAVSGAGELKPGIDGDACIGCGSCEYNCPAEGKAVTVSNAGERRRDE